jgi:tetratricopeptide (TPR) repeat protein
MAFGFGFNKQKALSAAEKFVQQGKLQNAITEYEKVLKADPKDLTVSNTVGDLYARLGQNDKAVDCFKSVGDAYAAQGFTVKAIAMYKKLSKLKPSLDSVLRLAELYTQQGLFNDARAQYLQVAEEFLKAGELEQAVRIFQKTLEMDPENVAMRMRLADVYIRLNKKTEAWQIYAAAAESLRARGAMPQAEEILQRMLTLDPGNSYALLLKGRTALEAGDAADAIKNLEKVADLDNHPEGLRALLQAYLQTGRLPEAGTLAAKLFSVHNDLGPIVSYAAALTSAGQFEEALKVYQQYSDRLLALDSGKILETLHGLIGHLRENPAALETLIELFNKAGENTHLTEVYELLAHAYVQSGELERARDYYLKLTQLEPQNQLHTRNYQQVLAKLGGGATVSRLITAEEGAILVDELEATAPFVDQRYTDETALAVRAALTDAELFISYNMPAKALGPLLSVLPKAPRDLRLNQRLAALHTRASRFAEAAICCRTLESIYHDAGHPDEASRYGELAAKYEERSGSAEAAHSAVAEEIPVAPAAAFDEVVEAPVVPALEEFPAMETLAVEPEIPVGIEEATPAAAVSEEVAPAGLFFQSPVAAQTSGQEFEIQPAAANEIDISSEWEDSFETAAPESAAEVSLVEEDAESRAETITQTTDELRFYLAHEMADQAEVALAKLKELKAEPALLQTLQQEIAAAQNKSAVSETAPVEDFAVEEVQAVSLDEAIPEISPVEEAAAPALSPWPEMHPAAEAAPEPTPATLEEFVSDLESSLGDGFLPETLPVEAVEQPEPEPEAAPAQEAVAHASAAATPEISGEGEISEGVLGEFVADLENSLGENFLAAAPAPFAPEPPTPVTAAAPPVVSPAPAPPIVQPEIAIAAKAAAAAPTAAAPVLAPAAKSVPEAAAASPFTYQPTPIRPLAQPPAAAPAASAFDTAASIDLADMFGELKHELEEDVASTDEDPETHYNLGVAFREMGLLDEAIGELQKVCQAVERGSKFANIMQTYTWLAQCFLDKGVPEAAIRWYEKALKLPELNEDTRVALHYELASSYEIAQNKAAALQHFMEVYGSNIDYRDVAERIKALKS